LGPLQHRFGVGELGAVPVLFPDSPATHHRIVFAVIRWIVQEADGFANVIGKLAALKHDPVESSPFAGNPHPLVNGRL
jgi:hypothetical protein